MPSPLYFLDSGLYNTEVSNFDEVILSVFFLWWFVFVVSD
jgi:hypothetical protein